MIKNVFVHIPKTAGNSVRHGLRNVDFIDIGHSSIQQHGLIGPEYFRFCFVRNPLARLRSAFFHLVQVEGELTNNKTDKFMNRRRALRDEYGYDYDKFLAEEGYAKYNIAHFLPQTTWTHENNAQLVEWIGRLERIDEDWEVLGKKLGEALPPLKAKNPTKSSEYTQLRSSENKEFVAKAREFYANDFDLLGY